MAETGKTDREHPVEPSDENEAKVEGDADSGEGDDYSSGSDRSFEAEDAENCRGDAELEKVRTSTHLVAARKKRRHGSHGSRRHKGGSRHKIRGFHPYNLDPEEEMQLKRKSQEIKEKENAAAVVRQEGESRFMSFPVAPFNSTQFLMDEHDSSSPAGMHKTDSFSKLSEGSEILHSLASTPAESHHDMVSLERKDKEFTDIYTTVHAESLQSLPKDELVKNYMNLEEKVAALQKKVAEAEQQKKQNDDSGETKMQECQEEVHCEEQSLCDSEVSASDKFEISTTSLTSSNVNFLNLTTQAVTRPTISVGDVKPCAAPAMDHSDVDLS
ncbi:protein HEXIM2 [Elysia marginata]|uniref:Protein HEXIM2 n=1 Tax=Elysia marginata TaxID=1093978 RepID=A0AAV4FRR3_9GAST|nr:protein HEXIM2 [Elysia marginata]